MFVNKKNKEGKRIIIYHDDDVTGIKYARLLTLKGFNNVSIVTGGISEFGAIYRENIQGKDIPEFKLPESSGLTRKEDLIKKTRRIQKNAKKIKKTENVKNPEKRYFEEWLF